MYHSNPFWQNFNTFQRQTLLQPYMPLPNFNLLQPLPIWSTQTPPLLYFNGAQTPNIYAQHPFLPPFAEIPTHLTPQVTTTTTTVRPKFKDTEPTTKRPSINPVRRPMKTINTQIKDDFQNDAQLLAAVRNINSNFVIEEIVPVPGQLVYRQVSAKADFAPEKLQKSRKGSKKATNTDVKVEATGKTSTSGIVPQIPFDTYFLPYLSNTKILGNVKKPSALILEPHAKAIVGNGGTAISTPISRAVLKRGVPTNVYFNPESVAIAGVGGKAHAQADLELDLMNRRR